MVASDDHGLSAEKRALLEQRLHRARAGAIAAPPAPECDRMPARAPLSPAQEQLWYFSQLVPGNPVYNEGLCIRKAGPLELGALRDAFSEIVRRHAIWRTTFHEEDGEPVQVVGPPPVYELPLIDLSDRPRNAARDELVRLVSGEVRRPYDLATGPLLRPLLIRLDESEHRLYLCLHHLIFDAVGLARAIFPELVAIYTTLAAGGEPRLPAAPMQYARYATELSGAAGADELERRVDHWRARLADVLALELRHDHPRPPNPRFRGRALETPLIPAALAERLRSLGHANGSTLFQVLAAAFAVLLARYTGQAEVVFATLSDMRDRRELELMVGYCLTPLVLLAEVDGSAPFTDVLEQLRGELADGLAHLVGFDRLVRELRPERPPGANPLFQVAIVLEPGAPSAVPGWSLHQLEASVTDAVGSAKFDLLLDLDERPEGQIEGRLIYDRDLFDHETMERFAGHWANLLEAVATAPERPIAELALLGRDERHRQLVAWNTTDSDYPREATLHELVADQSRRSPEAVAAVFGSLELTFRELEDRADALAARLAARNPERGPVAVYLERSLEMLVGLLAVLKSGAPYVPLDPSHPALRTSWLLRDCAAPVLLTASGLLAQLSQRPGEVVLIDREEPGAEPAAPPPTTGEDRAYILYTSGSTGQPKGVCVTHRSLVNVLTALSGELGVGPDDAILAITTYAFDIAAVEFWLPLITGARVVIAGREAAADPRALAALAQSSRVTLMQATPTAWRALLQTGWAGHPSLTALSGGEPLAPDLAEALLQRAGRVWNMYGPTETTVWSTAERLESGRDVTIGRPLANTRVYVLSPDRQLVPTGVAGELAIGGDGVAEGYLGRPELTRERFVPDPFRGGDRIYLTGDLVRQLPDGRIEHLGRVDDQLKVRGFRVEPAEVESALRAGGDIGSAAVIADESGPAGARLIAYLVPKPGQRPEPSELRRRLASALPSYMVPSRYVLLDVLPTTASGKLDRAALPAPDATSDRRHQAVSARSVDEERMAALWARTLELGSVGVEEDFFELGGHSLLALHLLTEVEREFGASVGLDVFFQTGGLTVRALVDRLAAGPEEPEQRGRGTDPILFFVQPHKLTLVALRHFVGPGYRLVGLSPEGSLHPSQSIDALVDALLAKVRTIQGSGPYFLAGYSLGGVLAYDIAGALRAEGEAVAWLGVIDAWTPDAFRRKQSLPRLAGRLITRGPGWALDNLSDVVRYRLAHRGRPAGATHNTEFDWVGSARMAARHRCRPHDAPLDLFVTQDTADWLGSDTLGWGELHRGPLHLHHVRGDHAEIMDERVYDLADLLSASFTGASGR